MTGEQRGGEDQPPGDDRQRLHFVDRDVAQQIRGAPDQTEEQQQEGVSRLHSSSSPRLRRVSSHCEQYAMPLARQVRGLYVIIDPDACLGRSPVEIARQAIEGGANALQWRDKRREKSDQLADARAIAELCRAAGAIFIVNDHVDLAMACDADGVHLGQHDLPIDAARPIAGQSMIIGVSTNNAAEARAAEAAGADYVAVGAIFSTVSKGNTRPANLDRIREVKAAVRVPIVAIGGIDASNIRSVIDAGADATAVISAVGAADDPQAAARELASAFKR
jgi:thiamine-phosphate diphosphorylase